MKKLIIIAVVAFILVIIYVTNYDFAARRVEIEVSLEEVVDYGEGVYYFPYVSSAFGKALPQFLKKHSELELISLCGNGVGFNGQYQGYFVVFKTK